MTKKQIILSLIILFLLSFLISFIVTKHITYERERLLEVADSVIDYELNIELITENELEKNENIIGKLIIPVINLEAPIQEGTSQKVLRFAIGHFENSSFFDGNVALAAHNRGNITNYFERVKELTFGDEIIYKTRMGERRYEVCSIKEIRDTDWSVISNSDDNMITLITCINNKPDYRLCVQGIEK